MEKSFTIASDGSIQLSTRLKRLAIDGDQAALDLHLSLGRIQLFRGMIAQTDVATKDIATRFDWLGADVIGKVAKWMPKVLGIPMKAYSMLGQATADSLGAQPGCGRERVGGDIQRNGNLPGGKNP